MNVEQKANATLSELLINRVQQLIIDNEEERIAIRAKSGIKGSLEGSKFYRPDERAQGRIKQLTRDLGALLTTDEKSKEALIKELDKLDLINNPGDLGEALSKYLKGKEGKEIYYKKVRDMTVGHHPTATNILRDALAGQVKYDKNFNIIKGQIVTPRFGAKTRQELKKISKKNNYLLGDDVIAYIDPAAHKEFTTKLKGLLSQRLNLNNKKDLEQFFNFQELLQRSAHARAFGGTQGIPLPRELLTGKEGAEQIFKIAKPYLDLAKAGTAQGLDMHALLKNTDWSKPEDLLKVVQSAKIPNTDKLLQSIYESQINNGITPSGRLISAFTDPSNLLDKHKSIWNQSRKGVVPLGNIATKLDLNRLGDLDLSLGTQSPIERGATKADLWTPSGIFQFSGDGAAAIPWQQQGLFSGVIDDVVTASGNLDKLGGKALNKIAIWNIANKGGMKPLQNFAGREFLPGTVLGTVFDKNQRNRLSTALSSNEDLKTRFTAGTEFANQAIRDEAIGQAVWHGVVRPINYGWSLLPGAVQSVLGPLGVYTAGQTLSVSQTGKTLEQHVPKQESGGLFTSWFGGMSSSHSAAMHLLTAVGHNPYDDDNKDEKINEEETKLN